MVVVHGGPGAPGEMAAVARRLSSTSGVLEPLQTATTVGGQVRELKAVLENEGEPPLILIGFSWGAMLSFILTARHPALVKKLILISSGAFEEKYSAGILEVRLSRLGEEEREELFSLMAALDNPDLVDKQRLMARLGELIFKADSYSPLLRDSGVLEYQYDIFHSVWEQAREMRQSGKLLELGKKIQCPVVAIHGDYDPHNPLGVKDPLSRVLKDFRFILLEKCGHYPWLELNARDNFFQVLNGEVL